jgi:hypothetical protein
MALVSALFPVATAVNAPNYAKLYHAAMVVNANIYLGASLAVMMPFVTFVAVFRDVNFVIALMHVVIGFNVSEIGIVETAIATVVIAAILTATVAILEAVISVTVIADMKF